MRQSAWGVSLFVAAETVRVFLAGTSLDPSYGGPAYSVSRMAIALTESGVQVGLWTPDQSVATSPLLAPDSAVLRLTGPAARALDSFGKSDVLHDNGLWRSHNHRLAQLAGARGIPRVVSTRGMLEPWAVRHKSLRKRLAWPLYQKRDLQRAAILHTTSEAEAANVEHLQLGVLVRVIPNGIDAPDPSVDRALDLTVTTQRTAAFLGRLYPVKGLPMLIHAWARVRPPNWVLKIAGPDEANHQREIEAAIHATGLQDSVLLVGTLHGRAKRQFLEQSDLFVLPSYSESFGVVVAEALAHGVPVLTTTAVPWPTLTNHQCGWRVPATIEGLAKGLTECTSLDETTLRAFGANGRNLVAREFEWGSVARRFIGLYEDVMSGHLAHPRP